MKNYCPACGSESIISTSKKQSLPVTYGSPAIFDEVLDKCALCGESGDFSGANDQAIEMAVEIAKKESVLNMLNHLSAQHVKMSYMERALELPARTIARWKNGELSAATIALLRIIRTYPWILEVADAKYDQTSANSKLVEEAANVLQNAVDKTKPFQFRYESNNTLITGGTRNAANETMFGHFTITNKNSPSPSVKFTLTDREAK